MKPAPFDYACPDSLDEALELRREHGGEARVLAGGQSLGAMLNMRLATPRVLVDITGIEALDTIAVNRGAIRVGAAVTQEALNRWPGLDTHSPILARALPWVGHYATRQRGTVCGSVVHSDPSSELPLVLALLQGEVELRSARGKRLLAARDFQLGMLQTDVADDEVAVAVRFPLPSPGTVSAFHEVAQRHGDFAMVAVAALGDGDGVSVAVGGVGDVPVVERFEWTDDAGLDGDLNALAWRLGASGDAHASAAYRRRLVRKLGRRAAVEVRDALPAS